jgi:outer membrane protein insertion porin family
VSRPANLARIVVATALLTSTLLAHADEGAEDHAAEDAQAVAERPQPIAGWTVQGEIDRRDDIEALLADVAPVGAPFVTSGDADKVGMPIGTIPRLVRVLNLVGYSADVRPTSTPTGVRLAVQLHPFDRVRHIFVSGNQHLIWGIRQENIIGKLSIRPGQKLPPAGPQRDAFFARETDNIREYVRSQGYWEAEVGIESRQTTADPSGVSLLVRVQLGPAYPLGPLTVTGATALPTDSIADGFHHGIWYSAWQFPQPFRRSVLREDMANLVDRYRRIGFPGVRVHDDFNPATSVDRQAKNVRLAIDIRERRHITTAFEGNRSLSNGALQDALTLTTHGAYDDVEASASAAAIERLYLEHGHMLVKVTWRRERLSEHSDRLVFVIDEGPMLKVRGVSFVGNHALPSDTLAERIRTKTYPFLAIIGLGEGGFASLRQLELDVESLVDLYASLGYPGTKVRAEIAPQPGQWVPLPASIEATEETLWRHAKSLYVRFLIEEAPLLWVAAMEFVSASPEESLPREPEFFLDSLRTTVGAPFQPAFVKRDEVRIKRALGDLGYRYAEVEAHTEQHGDQIHLTWKTKLGPQVHVGPIFIRGNFLTTDKTILTWAELRTGDVLTTRGLERAQRNLALIQLFNNPNPLTFPETKPNDPVVPMVIEVEERHDHWGVFRVGGGAATDQALPGSSFPLGVYGTVGYEHRNPLGHGWTLTGQGNMGSNLTSLSSSFLNPRFLGSLFRMQITASYLRQATIRLGDIHSGAGSFGFAREMYPGVDANVRYNLRNTSRTELLLRGATSAAFQEQTTVRIGTFVSSISAGVEWHRLDHVLVPTRGFKVEAGIEVALPALSFGAGQDTFIKVYGHELSVVQLLPWLSLRYSLRYDQGLPLGGASVLPKVERFFAGGDTSIRGYQLDHALTETIRVPGTSGPLGWSETYVQYRPIGGNLRILQNVDLQFPLSPPLYGSLFWDSGMLGYSLDGISASDFRHGIGFSPLLIKLPVGDVSLSFAIPLNRRPGDDTWRTHFNVGLMF